MPDVVVTVPLSFGLQNWIDEGDAVGEPESGEDWDFYLYGNRPDIKPGERVYVVYNGAVRGYAPLIRVDTAADSYFVRRRGAGAFSLVRRGGAVAVTIPEQVQGFRGWRYRWWDRSIEVPFPNWTDPWACIGFTRTRKPSAATAPNSTAPEIPDNAVVFACARPSRRARQGSSGSPASPNTCPAGLDPRTCDTSYRTPYPADARFYTCSKCGKQGKFAISASEATPAARVVNVKLEPCDVYIGRTMPGGKWVNAGWGNPFSRKLTDTPVADFRAWIQTQPQLLARLPELRGKKLGCWCAPKGGLPGNINGHTCHGEVLAALAESEVPYGNHNA